MFRPSPRATLPAGFQDTAGFTLTVWMLDRIAWKRPIQPSSYSVTRPNGAVTPSPIDHSASIGITAYRFGTIFSPPASPPLPPRVWEVAGCEAAFEKLSDGLMKWSAPTPCAVRRRDMPATFDHSVVASSAAAAAPAKALPRPEADVSLSWKPAPRATDVPSISPKPATVCATGDRTNGMVMVLTPCRTRRSKPLRRHRCAELVPHRLPRS
jgi:hypothetical protein